MNYHSLLDPENFKTLITYATSEPDIDDLDFDQKKCYKYKNTTILAKVIRYPFVCAELLSTESQAIANEFFKSKAELEEAERAEEEREKKIERECEEAEKAEKTSALDDTNATDKTADQSEIVIGKESQENSKEEDAYQKFKTIESREISEGRFRAVLWLKSK